LDDLVVFLDMGNLAADVRYASRMMRANPAFTAAAITSPWVCRQYRYLHRDRLGTASTLPYLQPDRIM